jgi:hypothetical protein
MDARIGVREACRVKLGRSRGPRARMGEKIDFQNLEIWPTFYPELAGRARQVLWSPWVSLAPRVLIGSLRADGEASSRQRNGSTPLGQSVGRPRSATDPARDVL